MPAEIAPHAASKTIAALLGPALVATAISILANTDAWFIEGLTQNPILVAFAGYALFVLGLAIVYFHNRWTRSWTVLITVMGWLALLIGLVRMIFPVQVAASNSPAIGPGAFAIVALVFLLIGGFLWFKAYPKPRGGRLR